MELEAMKSAVEDLAKSLEQRLKIPWGQACHMAQRAAFRVLGRPPASGMGASQVDQVRQAAEQVRQMVSPWLWVTSLLGFGLAVLNSKRISVMYGSWKRARQRTR